jgi:DNA primase
MGILDEDVAAVRAASDIVGIVTQYLQLRRVGRNWTGLCPFHPERTPSFSVNGEHGVYYCLAGETRVVTWDGVREIRDLAGTTARVLTEGGVWVDAPFSSFGVQPLLRITLSRNGRRKVVHATPEHRWLVRSGRAGHFEKTTAQLRSGHMLAWSFPASRLADVVALEPAGVAGGLAFGAGTVEGAHVRLTVDAGRDPELLKWLPPGRGPAGGGATVELPASHAEGPDLDEPAAYLAGWLAGYLAAVGEVAADGTCSLTSPRRDDLDRVMTLCARLGVSTLGITAATDGPGADGEGPDGDGAGDRVGRWRLDLVATDLDERLLLRGDHRERFLGASPGWRRLGWTVNAVEATDRVEEVFCAQVEGTHSFTLEDNVLTGNCFGCQAKGDVITFVREKEQLDFVGAVEWLAGRAGITLHYTDRNEGEGRKRRAKLVKIMEEAVEWYHQRLLSSPDAGAARRYLRERGLDGDVVREYRIGWAPDAWDEVCRALRLNEDDARETGLGFRNSRGRMQDTFRARVMFPISDPQGDPVSFGGRILPGHDDPRNHGKYKNTPETPLYHKSKVLYGLDRSKAGIVSADTAIVCEGYTDVIGFARSGVPLAVATCGTALTDEHVRLLRRYARRLVLAFDADGAGQAAAERFYQWERDHDLEVAVADLPEGQDPADVARTDPERLEAAVSGATPFLRFRLDRAFAAGDLTTPEGRAKMAERALAIVGEHPVDLVRDQYLMEVASRCRMDPERLRPGLDRAIEAARAEARRRAASGSSDGRDGRSGGGDGRGQGRSGAGPGASGGPAGARRSGDGRSPYGAGPGRGGDGRGGGSRPGEGRPGARRPGDGRGAPRGSRGPGGGGPSSAGAAGPAGPGDAGAPNRDEAPPPGWEQWAGDPGGAGWAGDTGDDGWDDGPSWADDPGPGGGGTGPGSWRDDGTGRPALEVLRHVVHNRDEIVPWLTSDVLFRDPTHQEVLRALAASPSAREAMDAATDRVADLLARLAVDEPGSEPFEALRRLGTEVARAELTALRLGAASHDDPGRMLADTAFLNHCISDLRTVDTSMAALERLLAWLNQRVGDGG